MGGRVSSLAEEIGGGGREGVWGRVLFYEWEGRSSMDGGIGVRVGSAAAASTSAHWQQCSGTSHFPSHNQKRITSFPCSR